MAKLQDARIRLAGNQIVTMWKVRYMIPRSGPPREVKPGETPPPNVMIITQHFVEVEWKGGGEPLLFKRYKVKGEWRWSNPRRNRNNPHFPKSLTDDEAIADLASMCYKGDRDKTRELLADVLDPPPPRARKPAVAEPEPPKTAAKGKPKAKKNNPKKVRGRK